MSPPGKRLVVLLRSLRPPATAEDPGRTPDAHGALPHHALMGACERAALNMALALHSQLGGALTALALGTARQETPVLEAALAAGCTRAVCVASRDAALDDLDYLGVAELLGTAIRHLGCDLLVCGDRSQDERHGAVGPAVAELLGMNHLTAVVAAQAGDRPGTVIAHHRGDGVVHRFRCALPVVLCAAAHDPAAQAPARRDPAPPVEHLELADLGVDSAALGRPALGAARPPRASRHSTTFASADALIARLVADRLLP